MLESFANKFEYKKLSEQEQKERGILGRLVGPIADTAHPTRNGRKYSKALWEKVFNDPIVQEKIDNRCFFGELDHPADREETCSEKVAVCLAEKPKVGKDGVLYGVFDILPTPNGKIVKAFCDYGTTVGISSRGSGDIITDENGDEAVDEDTYDCQGFDIVLIPAVQAARLTYVTESLSETKTLKQILQESLNKASDDERKIMEDTLKNLKININESTEECNSENCTDIECKEETDEKAETETTNAENNGVEELVKGLQETLKANSTLAAQLQELQEKLAVSDTKVSSLNEELARYKNLAVTLSNSAREVKKLTEKVSTLEESLNKKDKLIEADKKQIVKLTASKKESVNNVSELTESLQNKDRQISRLERTINQLKVVNEKKNSKLSESLQSAADSSKVLEEKFNKKLAEEKSISEGYKKLAYQTINKYMEVRAKSLGITVNEIKNKLNESYTINDIEKVCDEIQAYRLNMSKLPINFRNGTKVRVTESKKPTLNSIATDDEVDDSLLKLAGLN